ncbi:MAG: cytidine deaminase [Polyangiaceae bacterium]|nr:cytidine deaminase [Myxococcales bacterium]MCB9589963.1 cytidine deaminase [Polyangiaceae bacterium]
MPDLSLLSAALDAFPVDSRAKINAALADRAVIPHDTVRFLMDESELTVDHVMLRLLPVAAAFAVVPISNYRVGVVAEVTTAHGTTLYLGANCEFDGGALPFSVHGEQSAIVNAWVNGERGVNSLAISAAPCGYCRQFLNELGCAKQLDLLLANSPKRRLFSDFLPQAFGPSDLGVSAGLLSTPDQPLELEVPSDDPLVRAALAAAQRSYAPYSHDAAGVALMTKDDHVVAAPYAENAAYNPSMSPMCAARTALEMNRPVDASRAIRRAVLVESEARASQRRFAESILATFAPDVELECFRAINPEAEA